jgi:hypothetical protein
MYEHYPVQMVILMIATTFLDDINRIFRHRNDTVYVDYIKLYTSRDNLQYSDNQYILRKDSNEIINDYIFNKEYINSPRIEQVISQRRKRKCIRKCF